MSFPADLLDLDVQLFLGGAWVSMGGFSTDPLGDTANRLTGDPITITHGRSDEASTIDPASVTVTLNNADGALTPKRRRSPWFPHVARDAPLRIWAEGSLVFCGEIFSITPTWPIGDQPTPVVLVEIVANGVMRRLNRHSTPLRSALYRCITSPTNLPHVADYYPMEEGTDATFIASGLPASKSGHDDLPRMSLIGWTKSSDAALWGSEPLPNLGSGEAGAWNVRLSRRAAALDAHWAAEQTVRIPSGPSAEGEVLRWDVNTVDGSHVKWTMTIAWDGTNAFVRIRSYNAASAIVVDALAVNPQHLFGDFSVTLRLEVLTTGGGISWSLTWSPILLTSRPVEGLGSTVAGTGGHPVFTRLEVDAAPQGGITWGHLVIHDGIAGGWLNGPDIGHQGEMAHVRFERLCGEEGYTSTIFMADPSTGLHDTSQKMGTQRPRPLADLLEECAATDSAIICEARDSLALEFRSGGWRYNPPVQLALDAAADQIVNPFTPTDDDQQTLTTVKASRIDGSSFTVVDPDATKVYDGQVDLSLYDDSKVAHQAGWHLHLGQAPELRYRDLSLDLAVSPELIAAWLATRVAHRVQASNLPEQHPEGTVEQIVQGWSETLSPKTWTAKPNCTPSSPWTVARWGIDRFSPAGCTLVAGVDGTATTLTVSQPGAPWIDSASFAAQFPFNIVVGDDGVTEEMTVTAITGTASPQTMTVVRNVDGHGAPHSTGASVVLAVPAILAL